MSRQIDRSTNSSMSDDQQDDDDDYLQYSNPNQRVSRVESMAESGFDLKPPPPSHLLENIEYLAERMFSADHLRVILKNNISASQFRNFLMKYRPSSLRHLEQYAKVQKAISAIEYANALAESVTGPGSQAAVMQEKFEDQTVQSINELVNEALPGYITFRLVQIVSELLVKEITGQSTPTMRNLVSGLAEVYCLTDPALPDNPIVYASEEFYRCTQYGRDYVIGRNCRFLQGPKSSGSSVQRLVDALAEGQEICETILNYRRDGSPFVNLLMIAPLYDNKGVVRYFIGAQIDVNGLIEGGRGLDSMELLLREDRSADRYGGRQVNKAPEEALSNLFGYFDDQDQELLYQNTSSRQSDQSSRPTTSHGVRKGKYGRRYIGMDDPTDQGLWPSADLGLNGRLPGVFQNYLLIRPYPSLRITFTSPGLRIPGLLQSKFLDRVGGSSRIRDQILDAFASGVEVTARINWLSHSQASQASKDGDSRGGSLKDNNVESEQRWIHATPLVGSDEKVGVWMVVMIDSQDVASSGRAKTEAAVTNNVEDRKPNMYQRSTSSNDTRPSYEARDSIQKARDSRERNGLPTSSRGQSSARSNNGYRPPSAAAMSATSMGESPKVFPGELKPITSAFGGVIMEDRSARSKMIAERALAGEGQFKQF